MSSKKQARNDVRMHFAIVGGGLTATAVLYQIVEETRRAVGLWAYNPTTISVSIKRVNRSGHAMTRHTCPGFCAATKC